MHLSCSKHIRWALILIPLLCMALGGEALARTPRVLVFCKTAAFHHNSIPAGIAAIRQLGKVHHFDVDTTTDGGLFTKKNLRRYQAVIFLNTSGDVLNDAQQAAFESYIRGGGGFVGVHGAAETEYGWPWYGKLLGAYFQDHPVPQTAVLDVVDHHFPGTAALPDQWKHNDEWYNFKSMGKDLHVLVKIDESSYQGGKMGANHPVCWYHDYDGGRAFYIGMGHADACYSEPLYLGLLYGGIQYAMKTKKP